MPLTDSSLEAVVELLCVPPGTGWAASSTGVAPFAAPLHERLYGSTEPAVVRRKWLGSLAEIRGSRAAVVGIPFDLGTSGVRGSASGPTGIRLAGLPGGEAFLDLGDVTGSQQLHLDELLSAPVLAELRRSRYGNPETDLPIGPLSCVRALARAAEARKLPLVGLGGDHSITAELAAPHVAHGAAVLQIDAHDDLGAGRAGIELTHSSWILALDRRHELPLLVQFGVPKHARRPDWIADRICRVGGTSGAAAATEIVRALKERRISAVYISVDIDVLHESEAPATGLPGTTQAVHVEDIELLINRLAANVTVVGADVVEVAPILAGRDNWGSEPTCRAGARVAGQLLAVVKSTVRVSSRTAPVSARSGAQ